MPEVLSSIAGGSITLAGFAAVFRAFSGTDDPDGHSRVRLNSVIEGGLVIAFVCYLPVWLASIDLKSDVAWRVASGLIVIWTVPRILVPTAAILRDAGPLPEMFRIVVFFGIVALLAAALNAAGIWPYAAYSGHLLAVIALFANVAAIFIA
ncbi:MAG: hypothetical protein AAFX10_06980 [Pseudomonadota bacterium]